MAHHVLASGDTVEFVDTVVLQGTHKGAGPYRHKVTGTMGVDTLRGYLEAGSCLCVRLGGPHKTGRLNTSKDLTWAELEGVFGGSDGLRAENEKLREREQAMRQILIDQGIDPDTLEPTKAKKK